MQLPLKRQVTFCFCPSRSTRHTWHLEVAGWRGGSNRESLKNDDFMSNFANPAPFWPPFYLSPRSATHRLSTCENFMAHFCLWLLFLEAFSHPPPGLFIVGKQEQGRFWVGSILHRSWCVFGYVPMCECDILVWGSGCWHLFLEALREVSKGEHLKLKSPPESCPISSLWVHLNCP